MRNSILLNLSASPLASPATSPSSAFSNHSALVRAILKSVRAVDSHALLPVASPQAGAALQPPALLALLTYCYVNGILSSQHVVAHLASDALLGLLCNNELPDWHVLRRFRRYNRSSLQHCLQRTCESLFAESEPCRGKEPTGSSLPAERPTPPATIASHIEECIETAVWLDSETLNA